MPRIMVPTLQTIEEKDIKYNDIDFFIISLKLLTFSTKEAQKPLFSFFVLFLDLFLFLEFKLK